jgi:hypothetical protein
MNLTFVYIHNFDTYDCLGPLRYTFNFNGQGKRHICGGIDAGCLKFVDRERQAAQFWDECYTYTNIIWGKVMRYYYLEAYALCP